MARRSIHVSLNRNFMVGALIDATTKNSNEINQHFIWSVA